MYINIYIYIYIYIYIKTFYYSIIYFLKLELFWWTALLVGCFHHMCQCIWWTSVEIFQCDWTVLPDIHAAILFGHSENRKLARQKVWQQTRVSSVFETNVAIDSVPTWSLFEIANVGEACFLFRVPAISYITLRQRWQW